MIDFACRECGRFFRVSDEKAGRKGKCPDCGADIYVPILDEDIEFSEPSIDENNTLEFELKDIYQYLLLLRSHLSLCGSKVAEGRNVVFATFCVLEGRTHTVSVAQQAEGGPINCLTTIGDVDKLSKQQIIDVLKRFHSEVLFNAGVNEDNELVAQIFFLEPPKEAAELCVSMLSLAKFADCIECDFFGVDIN